MNQESKKKVEFIIEDNLKSIRSNRMQKMLESDPHYFVKYLQKNKLQIESLIGMLRERWGKLAPYILEIKSKVADITEQTHVCAVYLLMCRISAIWESIFLLAQNGHSATLGNQLRMLAEADMQASLFVVEFQRGERINLENWFKGRIITHGIGRKKVTKHFEKFNPAPEIDLKSLESHIYQIQSQTAHNAYSAILEQVSPLDKDYDFGERTRFYRTISYLEYSMGTMTTNNITLKSIYAFLIPNETKYSELNALLVEYDPGVGLAKQVDAP